jgi:hypothetical protein
MAHHSGDPFSGMMGQDAEVAKIFRKERESATGDFFHYDEAKPGLGATGEFPQGKLTPEDEGEIRIGVTVFNGKVVVDFGEPTTWFGMDPKQARSIGELLIRRAAEVPPAV